MLLEEEREQLVCFGRRLVTSGAHQGTGETSVLRRHEGLWALTPSGLDYFEARPEDVGCPGSGGTRAGGAPGAFFGNGTAPGSVPSSLRQRGQ